jgi:P4 family phage/plasmid primase-like protien
MSSGNKYFDKNRFIPARLAKAILRRFAFLTFKDTHEICCYNKDTKIYHDDGADVIREQVQLALDERTTQNRKNEVIDYIRDATLVDREEIEPSRNLIPLRDKILDIDTGEMLDYSREVPFFFKHCGNYDPSILDMPTEASGFIASTFILDDDADMSQDTTDLDIIQEVAGASFYRKSLFKKSLMLVGDGNNGKSVFLSFLISAIGPGAISTRSIYDLTFNRFASADLYHKTANVQADIGGGEINYTGRFKTLTGGDWISAEKKSLPSFNFINAATMIFSTNELPEIKRPDPVFYDRWILVEMPVKFVDDPVKSNERLLDPFLEDKLAEQIEVDWITTWAIEGLKRLLLNGRYSESVSSTDVKDRWINKTDSLAAFVKSSYVTETQDNRVTKQAFYEVYVAYCAEVHMTAVTDVAVGHRLPQLINTRTVETRPRSWSNIAIEGIEPQSEPSLTIREPVDDNEMRLDDYEN